MIVDTGNTRIRRTLDRSWAVSAHQLWRDEICSRGLSLFRHSYVCSDYVREMYILGIRLYSASLKKGMV